MIETITMLLPILLLIFLILIGIPIAYSLIVSGTIGIVYLIGIERAMGILISDPYSNVTVYLWTTIPLFILMAEFLSKSGITSKVFKAVQAWVGHWKGGLAIATTIANGGMAALTGSSTASAAAMASIAVPEMRKYGYDDRLSMGTVSAAGTFAMMLPPSLALIIFGVMTDTNIADLFIAAIVPGLLTIIGYIAVIVAWGLYDPEIIGSTDERYSWKDRITLTKPIYPAVLLVILVVGGLYSGAVTPTESGAVGAFGALLISLSFADLGWSSFNEALDTAIRTSTMIFLIMIGAMIFGRYLAITGITRQLVVFVSELPVADMLIFMLFILLYLVLGTIMNQSAILILTLPVTFPAVVDGLGLHPIWFGVVIVKTAEIGMVTPPLGLNIYVASAAVDVDVQKTFSGAFRFLIADVIVLMIMILFPRVVTWLPATLG